MSTVGVYLRLIRLQVRSQAQYRTGFLLSVAGTFLFTTLDFAAILVLFHNVHSIGGWSAAEVSLLYASAALSYAITDMVLGSLDTLPQLVRDGTFDSLLMRPRSAFFQLLASDFMFRRCGRLLQAAIVLAVLLCGGFLHVSWTPARAAVLLSAVFGGAVILGAVWVVGACISFLVDGAGEFVNTFSTGMQFLAQYPLDIYSSWLRRLVVFVVPVGFVSYGPVAYLLGKDVGWEASTAVFLPPLVALASAAAATAVWQTSIRRYRSAGG
ncbi:ABC transporter permease [Streptomyces sp. NPDC020983]|uniref:ABC transporter permease n=1 Tax=Streptomyces sp. NPDC020983 TaxID=3365106 RepID=UPI0037AE2310